MRKFAALLLCITLIFSITLPFNSTVKADELDDINKKMDELNKSLQMSKSATAPLESTLSSLDSQINQISKRLDGVAVGIGQKKKELTALEEKIKKGEEELSYQEEVLAKRVRSYYIRSRQDVPFIIFLNADEASLMTRELVYRQAATGEDRRVIVKTVLFLKKLDDDKKEAQRRKVELESEQGRLAAARAKIDKDAAFYRKEIVGAKAYQAQLESEIAGLSSRQQALLAEKFGSFTTSVGEVPPADDNPQPTFSPAFAAFSFGAPHRVGMSQYGAFGRAKAGQNAEEILKAYYAGVEINKSYSVPSTITVNGYGTIPFEGLYLKGIGEMPSKWGDQGGMEALKAQAIAARTYAIAVTNGGQGSICATEACQVYLGYNKGGKWEEAVNATKGWVIILGGGPIKAYYASTAGGFTRSSADMFGGALSYAVGIRDVAGGSWPNDAYEGVKYGRSPWFYKAWYRSRQNASASRSSPWLTNEEMSDIVNAVLLFKADSGTVVHLSQTDKANSDTWSRDKVRQELSSRGVEPVNTINSIPAPQYSNVGYTASISFETDKGTKTFNGADFKSIFNLRAPGEIHLKSSLYNLEKR